MMIQLRALLFNLHWWISPCKPFQRTSNIRFLSVTRWRTVIALPLWQGKSGAFWEMQTLCLHFPEWVLSAVSLLWGEFNYESDCLQCLAKRSKGPTGWKIIFSIYARIAFKIFKFTPYIQRKTEFSFIPEAIQLVSSGIPQVTGSEFHCWHS